MARLDVWLYGEVVGRLEETTGDLRFTYAPAWLAEQRSPLSYSLPLRHETYSGEIVRSFFSNLLPEGDVRTHVARRLGISTGNTFGLLAAIGGDCAGAVSLLEQGATPSPARDEIHWLDERQLEQALTELPQRPLLADPEEGIRLSLAGSQDKLPVVCREGRVGVPTSQTPSTHIIKVPIERFDDTVVNELFCLRLARQLELPTAFAEIRRIGDRENLIVERYDRVAEATVVERLHQEDFCQALGLPPERKYESEGGPGLNDCLHLVRDACDTPAQDVLALLDAVTLNFLIGNHDAHAKNFSLLYSPKGTRLAPLYDLVSTAVYPGLTRKMAMKLGGEYRPEYVQQRHIERFANKAKLGGAATRRRMLQLAKVTPEVAEGTAAGIRAEGHARPVIDRILDTIAQRASHLAKELRDPPHSGGAP